MVLRGGMSWGDVEVLRWRLLNSIAIMMPLQARYPHSMVYHGFSLDNHWFSLDGL